MKARRFNSKDAFPITAFLRLQGTMQGTKYQQEADIWLFEHYLRGPVRSTVKRHLALSIETDRAGESYLAMYIGIFFNS